jgi:hypothetical protein
MITLEDLYFQNAPQLRRRNSKPSKQSFMSVVGAYKRTSHLGVNDNYLEPLAIPTLERKASQISQ